MSRTVRDRPLDIRMRKPRSFILVAVFMFVCASVYAQGGNSSGQASATHDGSHYPDFSGVWYMHGKLNRTLSPEAPPFTPWGLDQFKLNEHKLNPDLRCFPPGVPRIWTLPFPFEIIQLSGRVIIHYEQNSVVRNIHMDGRSHSAELPLWTGDSVGKYEGDTLVVDTTGFNDKTWLDNVGHPHSDQLHLIERISRPSHDVLKVEMTVEDPKAYTMPWTGERVFDLKPDWEISELVCEENNTYLNAPDVSVDK